MVRRRDGGAHVGRLAAVLGEVVEQVPREQSRLHLARGGEVADAVALVHAGPAERRRVEFLARHLRHHRGPGQEHACARAHDHEVVEGGAVGGAARRRAAHHRQLRHEPRQAHVLAEDQPVSRESREALLHARPRGLDEAHDGRPRATRQPQHLGDALGVRAPERSAEERGVLRIAADLASMDLRVRDQDAVSRAGVRAHPCGTHASSQQAQRPGIGERLEALERRELLVRTLGERERHAPSRQSTALCPPKPNEFDSASGARPFSASARARPGT